MGRLDELLKQKESVESVEETPRFDAPTVEDGNTDFPTTESVCNLQSISDEVIDDQVPTVASSAMQVHIEFTKWGGAVIDRTATDEVTVYKKSVEGAAIVKKKLLPESLELKRLETLSNTLRTRGVKYCLPWIGNGWYLLPTSNYADFMAAMTKAKEQEWEPAVEAFMGKYLEQVEEAQTDLGDLYDPAMYPSPEYVRAQFKMELHVQNVQMAGNFYADLHDNQVDSIRSLINDQNDRFVSGISTFIWDKLRKPLNDLMGVLDESMYGGVEKPKFKQSRVSNVTDAAQDAKRLNVSNDAQITSVVAKIEAALRGVTMEAIKDDMYMREHLRKAVTNILDGIPS